MLWLLNKLLGKRILTNQSSSL